MNKVLVTGCNRGIGLELCRQLLTRGDSVTAVCRQTGSELESLDLKVLEGVDVADSESLSKLALALRGDRFDWLINNAGILDRDSLESLDFDAIQRQFQVNAMGPLRVTHALLGNLGQGSKVGIVTSRMGSIGDNTSGGYYGYRMSKAAVNIAGVSLSRDLEQKGIAVGLLHPGMVATDMTGGSGVPVSQAASGLLKRMEELNVANSGSFWHAQGELLPW